MPTNPAIAVYLKQIQREYASGIAAEHAYRPALEALLESVDKTINAVNDPQRIIPGSAPDFVLLRDNVPVAITEAKDIGENLSRVESGEQMQRYLKAYRNVLLTDALEFRWYLDKVHQRTIRFASADSKRKTIQVTATGESDLDTLLKDFILAAVPDVHSARHLAELMASMTLQLRELIEKSLPTSDDLKGQKTSFEQTLIPNLDDRQFADMYAQTLAYGLFAARVNFKGKLGQFSRRGVAEDIPPTNPFLKKLFGSILNNLDPRFDWMVNALIDLLSHTDTDEVLKDFGKGTRQNDPVLHFYETFLAAYDPAMREKRGVYYTPEPVVSYIVRSVDYLLRERFKRTDGLADENTLILDPATGTGTFLYSVIQHIHELYKGQQGMWDGYVSTHILPRIFGFELLMAPYAIAHMKLGILLKETGYTFHSNERLGVYLTNTLEDMLPEGQTHMGFDRFITEEANAATAVKREKPIMVILGNPPYSGHSSNNGTWITELNRDYYQVDGQPLGERNPKWLNNDYVKFLRFGQWRIDQTGSGVLAFITDNSYLDNITFRGMRQHLMQAFTDIYILNLHGNSNKKEKMPDGNKDENVFDITQGVAIALFVKDPTKSVNIAQIHYSDLFGVRGDKYHSLLSSDLSNTNWVTILPQKPYYLFIPQNTDLESEYKNGEQINTIFSTNTIGIVTGQDGKTIALNHVEAVELANSHKVDESSIQSLVFHPFDLRYIVYNRSIITRSRFDVMQHMLNHPNISLTFARSATTARPFEHIFCSTGGILGRTYPDRACITYFAPLFLYPDPGQNLPANLDWPSGKDGRTPNLSKKFVDNFAAKIGLTFIPERDSDAA